MIAQLIFIVLLGIIAFFSYKEYGRVIRNIKLGKVFELDLNTSLSWKNVFLVALGQKKMFKNMLPAILHLFIYSAFVITQIELIEIIVDGITGNHRVFANVLGGFYTFIISFIEILTLLALVATVAFLARRNLLKIPRLVKSELNGWPKLDANLILIGELLLIIGIFTMNGTDTVLQSRGVEDYPNTGALAISSWLGPALFGGLENSTLIVLERAGWWLHILVVFGFLVYLPFSKHLHVIFAFPNVYFASQNSRGEMANMPEIMNEVKSMMGLMDGVEEPDMTAELPEFGAKDIFDLKWKNILDAYTCTECGRCSAECPANQTGKKLSPRKIMMSIRDRADEIGKNIDNGSQNKEEYDDGKSLFDYITKEEIHACTTCNACVEACPVMIDPLEPILELRRYEILTESAGPSDWLPMFNAIENGGAVWQMNVDRENVWKT